ncbi:hypothetical protein K1719_027763 [Acacia pycnantha]|nr:hypothetical protein K1719_027763 [Acacia pycnantha]
MGTVIPMLEAVLHVVPVDKLAVHFHDTYGQALSNTPVSLQASSSSLLCPCSPPSLPSSSKPVLLQERELRRSGITLTCPGINQNYGLVIFLKMGTVIPMLEAVLHVVPVDKLAVHFHDTYGQALSNTPVSLQVVCTPRSILLLSC